MNENLFEFASVKQNKLANTIRTRIISEIIRMENINELNELAGTKFEKSDLLIYFKNINDFRYFLDQRNISTQSIIVSAMIKLKRKHK
ncbi:hypothetical protein [Mammaliicoccus sciuri]|uniref:hypothetical protein n=1 Tax=Mammaliicoccus sciuri TaxID=1296 RepID=UPI003AE77713